MNTLAETLSNEQEEIVNFEGDEILVRGIAGSGKTLVMLKKAMQTAEKFPERKIGVFTFGKTLTNASELLMEQKNFDNLKLSTFHSWAMSVYRKVTRKKKFYIGKSKKILSDALKKLTNVNHRFIKEKDKYSEFLEEEISWIKGRGLSTLNAYQKASRTGRGSEVRVTQEDREIIYQIFNAYEEEKDYRVDYDDFGLFLFNNLDKIPEASKFDHVFVDEAQDLQQVQLIVLRSIAKKTFFVAADKGQKIYKTSFTWKDIGMNIRGRRTKILKESFRSTKQIIQLADSLQQKDSIINDDEYVPTGLPKRSGPVPDVFHCSSRSQQDKAIAKAISDIKKKSPNSTIGVLGRISRTLFRVRHTLNAENIKYEFVNNKSGNPYSPGVKLCTLHSSKGLEFDYVIILDLNKEALENEINTDEYWEVERRLLYVGITRAVSYLQLYYYEEPSQLLKELDDKYYNLTKL